MSSTVLTRLSFSLVSLLAAGATLLVGACSSGSGSGSGAGGGAGGDASAVLLFDTAAGGDYQLDARVDVLALETAAGTFTANLAPTGATLPLVRPSGTPGGIRLPALPGGTYVALRLMLAENGVTATDGSGRVETVTVPTRDLRVPFASAFGSARWLLLGNVKAPQLTRTGGVLTWTPDLAARSGDAHLLPSASLSLGAITGGELVGTLSACGDLRVSGRLDDGADLSDDSGARDRSGFLRDLRSGDDLDCDGVLTGDGGFHIRRAHRRSRGQTEAKVYGRITELLPAVPAIKIQVQEIVRSSPGLVASPLPVLTVRTESAHIHHSGVRTERLPFAALAVDQRVEVEWRGAVVDGTVSAHEVEIEDGNGNGGGTEIEGQVGSVDLGQRLIVAVPRGDDPLLVGGQSVPSATIVLPATTVITREAGGTTRTVGLDAAVNGDRIWIIGRVVEPQRVEAVVVRLRAAR